MMQKKDIETILKINGVSANAPDEEIRTVLLSARYNNDEVDTAIMVLKENTKTHIQRVDGLHKIFRTDEGLKPNEISSLLGIDVDVDSVSMEKSRKRELTWLQSFLMTLFAISLAILGVFLAMYFYQVGFFHPTVSAFGY